MSTNEDAPENGNGRATVALVDAKVDGLKDFIALGFENIARRLDDLAGLEPRIRTLEQTAATAMGPLTEGLRETDARVEALAATVEGLSNQSVTGDQVKTALAFDRDQREQMSAASFTQREKVLGLIFAAALVLLNFYEVVHSVTTR